MSTPGQTLLFDSGDEQCDTCYIKTITHAVDRPCHLNVRRTISGECSGYEKMPEALPVLNLAQLGFRSATKFDHLLMKMGAGA